MAAPPPIPQTGMGATRSQEAKMAEPKPNTLIRYTKMLGPDDEHPKGVRVYCTEADDDADECILTISSTHEFRFGRSKFDPKRWDPALDTLERALQAAFEQGRAEQRQIMRDALGLTTQWGGELHGRSGR